jgi:hypothetical protein
VFRFNESSYFILFHNFIKLVLDGDVILASQAILVNNYGHEVIVATTNTKHLSLFVDQWGGQKRLLLCHLLELESQSSLNAVLLVIRRLYER